MKCRRTGHSPLGLVVSVSLLSRRLARDDGTTWVDAGMLAVEGRPFTERPRAGRLPAEAEGVVRPAVWNLDGAGIAVRFTTGSSVTVR